MAYRAFCTVPILGVEYCLFAFGPVQSLSPDKRNAPHFLYTNYPPEQGSKQLPMKNLLVPFAFAVLFLTGCKQDSGVDDLRKEIEALKSTEIASVNSQITGIKSSISDL